MASTSIAGGAGKVFDKLSRLGGFIESIDLWSLMSIREKIQFGNFALPRPCVRRRDSMREAKKNASARVSVLGVLAMSRIQITPGHTEYWRCVCVRTHFCAGVWPVRCFLCIESISWSNSSRSFNGSVFFDFFELVNVSPNHLYEFKKYSMIIITMVIMDPITTRG